MIKSRRGGIIWSIKHRPPLSVTIISSILLILVSSKEQIIDAMPISNADTKLLLGSWYMYLLKLAGVIMGLLSIGLGLNKDNKPDTDNPN